MEVTGVSYRNPYVSISKGIAILLMVLGHTFFSRMGVRIIYMFHMPLFFFMSGYCFKIKYLNEPSKYFKQKIKGIWWPALQYGTFFILAHNLFLKLGIYSSVGVEGGWNNEIHYKYMLSDFLQKIFEIATKMSGFEQLLGGFWFLEVLFWASIISWAIIKCVNLEWGLLIVFILSIVAVYTSIHVPYVGIGKRELVASVFFIAGHLYKQRCYTFHKNTWFAIVSCLVIILSAVFVPAELLELNIRNVWTFVLCGVMGSISTLALAEQIGKIQYFNKLFSNIGDNTLPILTWHFLSFKVISFIIIFLYGLDMAHLANFPVILDYAKNGWWGGVFCCWCIIASCNLLFMEKSSAYLYVDK